MEISPGPRDETIDGSVDLAGRGMRAGGGITELDHPLSSCGDKFTERLALHSSHRLVTRFHYNAFGLFCTVKLISRGVGKRIEARTFTVTCSSYFSCISSLSVKISIFLLISSQYSDLRFPRSPLFYAP